MFDMCASAIKAFFHERKRLAEERDAIGKELLTNVEGSRKHVDVILADRRCNTRGSSRCSGFRADNYDCGQVKYLCFVFAEGFRAPTFISRINSTRLCMLEGGVCNEQNHRH